MLEKKRFLFLFAAISLCCGDGTDASTNDAGQSTLDGAVPTNACSNPSDVAMRDRSDLGTTKDQTLTDLAGDLGLVCVLGGESAAGLTFCVRDGLVRVTDKGVSAGCATCYGESVRCSAAHCIAECQADKTSMACTSCRCGNNPAKVNCIDVFGDCAGVPTSTCQ